MVGETCETLLTQESLTIMYCLAGWNSDGWWNSDAGPHRWCSAVTWFGEPALPLLVLLQGKSRRISCCGTMIYFAGTTLVRIVAFSGNNSWEDCANLFESTSKICSVSGKTLVISSPGRRRRSTSNCSPNQVSTHHRVSPITVDSCSEFPCWLFLSWFSYRWFRMPQLDLWICC